jgi:hypothetical protein
MQILVQSDGEKLQTLLGNINIEKFTRLVLKRTFIDIKSPLRTDDINHIKERRLTAKLFTILVRDFSASFSRPFFV